MESNMVNLSIQIKQAIKKVDVSSDQLFIQSFSNVMAHTVLAEEMSDKFHQKPFEKV